MAVTIEISFTLVENVKKISLFTKKNVQFFLRKQQVTFTKMLLSVSFRINFYISLKLVSISTSVISFNAKTYVIRCVMGFLFFPHSTNSNWKYPLFERDKSLTYKNVVGEHVKLNLFDTGTANWCMTSRLWHLLQTTWNMLKMSLITAFSHIKQGIIHIWHPWKLSNLQDSPTPSPSTSAFLPLSWHSTSSFKRTTHLQMIPCMSTNKIKTKTKPSHASFKLTTRSVVRFSPRTVLWYHQRIASLSDIRIKRKICCQ